VDVGAADPHGADRDPDLTGHERHRVRIHELQVAVVLEE
jgi:hypothetical protein